MLSPSPSDTAQAGFFDIFDQLNRKHPLVALSHAIDWKTLESSFQSLYSDKGRAAKPIRLMSGLLMLKQLYDLSDESVIEQWAMNPYYQVFCGEISFKYVPRVTVQILFIFASD